MTTTKTKPVAPARKTQIVLSLTENEAMLLKICAAMDKKTEEQVLRDALHGELVGWADQLRANVKEFIE